MHDRRRTELQPGHQTTFTLLGRDFIPAFDSVTSVSVVPFLADGQIVAAILQRGVDLPGGHVQVGEESVAQVAKREAHEEAGIHLRDIRVAQIIRSDFYGSDDLTYMVQVAALVDSLDEFTPSHESFGRVTLAPAQFLARYTAGDRETMRDILQAAHAVIFGDEGTVEPDVTGMPLLGPSQ